MCIRDRSRHDDPAVHLVLGIQEMHVAGSAYQLIELHAKFHDFLIDFNQVGFRFHRALPVSYTHLDVYKRQA